MVYFVLTSWFVRNCTAGMLAECVNSPKNGRQNVSCRRDEVNVHKALLFAARENQEM